MIPGVDAVASIAVAEIADAGVPNPLMQAWLAPIGRTFLYEVTAYKRGTSGAWVMPPGVYTPGEIPAEALVTGESVLRYSDTGYISFPTDSVANTNFDGSVDTGLQLTRTTPVTPEASRRVTLNLGSFSLNNGDGALDSIVRNYSVDGRRVRVMLGLRVNGYDTFVPVFTGRTITWDNDLNEVTVQVRDESYRLTKPMQTDLYGGTGEYDGGSDLAGKPRPMAFGQVPYIPAPLIDAANLIYQVHSRTVLSVDAVYDRGATITAGSDHANYAALVAATVTGGTYHTCLAQGLFRLGSTPSGLVTADVRGDAVGGYVDDTERVCHRIITDFGGMQDTDLEPSSWAAFQADTPGAMGWWQTTEAINVDDALNAIFGHCAAWWGPLPNGLIEVGTLQEPTTDSYYMLISEADDILVEILEPLDGTFPPNFRRRVGYQKLWAPQQAQDLAAAVDAARRQYLSQEYRVVTAVDDSVKSDFLLATDPDPLVSLYANAADAQSLVNRLLALYKKFRQTVRITMPLQGLEGRLSRTVLVRHSRVNSGALTPMLLMDITLLADDRQVELVVWG